MKDAVKIFPTFKEFDPRTESYKDNKPDFADEYIIEIRRTDGLGMTLEEFHSIISSYLIHKPAAERRARKERQAKAKA